MLELPAAVLDVIGADASWSVEHGGRSGSLWHVKSSAGSFYVRQGGAAELEHRAIRWIDGRIPTPRVVAFAGDTLALADANAAPASSLPPHATGAAMGSLLRGMHQLPVDGCPFDARVDSLVEQARLQVEKGLVNESQLEPENAGTTPVQLFGRLSKTAPTDAELVVTHGDYTPDNVLMRRDAHAPIAIDLARLGLGDRHRDLALAQRDLDTTAFDALLAAYEPGFRIDPDRMAWYRLLDEFF